MRSLILFHHLKERLLKKLQVELIWIKGLFMSKILELKLKLHVIQVRQQIHGVFPFFYLANNHVLEVKEETIDILTDVIYS